jgi:hypothetical protein
LSFGPKLDDLPEVPPGGTTTATLEFVPAKDHFKHQGTVYVEDLDGVVGLKLAVKSPP